MIDKSKKILMICESPAKIHTLTKIMKDLGYTKITIAASVGHITEIKDAKDSYNNTGIYPEENFRVLYAVSADKFKVVENLKMLLKSVDQVLIATDGDREGESIGYHLNAVLKIKDTQYFRITYHSITKDAIKNALDSARKLNDNLVDSAEARQIADKFIGYTLSPKAKTYVGAKSVGRCQSIGLKLIVDREDEIENFVPETYFDLYLNFDKNKTSFKAKYVGTDVAPIDHLASQKEVDKVKKACTSDYIVRYIEQKDKQESPKPPFCTATYQQEAANRLGLKVKDAMSCAQKLFEAGVITYHRTDATDIAADFIPLLSKYINETYGAKTFVSPRVGKKSDSDQEGHESLRITEPIRTPAAFRKEEPNLLLGKVYELIWQRTIASAMPNAVIAETTYNIYNCEHKFILKSNELKSAGYRQVYSYQDDTDEPLIKETFKKEEKLKNTSLEDIKKQTQPKPRYKEATLIKELQKREIGRPSTYATIVETVLSPTRGYATLEDKYIVPTEKGKQLAKFLDRAFSDIINYDYTKNLEEALDKIATGKLSEMAFLTDFFNKLENAVKNNKELALNADTGETQTCPKCGAPMVLRRSRFGKLFYGCSTYPKCNGIKNVD